jgi:uncharacterized protein YkwD
MRRGLLCISTIMLLAACQTAPPAPVPTVAARTATPTSLPAVTEPAVSTSTLTPSLTPSPSASPPPTASPTMSPTSTPTSLSLPTAAPTLVVREVYVNSDNGLNLRAEPDATGTVLRTLSPGTHLTAIGSAAVPDANGVAWQNVSTDDGQSGWVAAQFLIDRKPINATPTSTPVPLSTIETTLVVTPIASAGYVYVAAPDGLNLRAQASASSQLLRTLANGQRLQTNGLGFGPDENGITWFNVKTEDGVEGWVSVQFVTTTVPSVATPAPAVNVTEAVQEILRRTNALRQGSSVPAVTLNDDLSRLALEHGQYMAQNGISHVGADGLSARQRISNAGYGAGRPVENIFGGQATIDDAWDYWITDPPHLDVLLNAYNTMVGIGVYKIGLMTYYTMDFGVPAR